jgi:hypothetical protein
MSEPSVETGPEPIVESMHLAVDMDRRVAQCSVRIGDLKIHGVAVWRGKNGRLRVFFPSYRLGFGTAYGDAIELPADLRSRIEAEVIVRYREAIREEKKCKP